MFLSTLFIFLRGTIAGMGYYRVDSLLSVCDKVLMIFIIGYFVWVSSHQEQFDISTFIYGQGVAYLLSCVFALLFLYNKLEIRNHKLTFEYVMDIVKWSSPYILVMLLMTSYNRLDGVMLGKMLNDNNFQAGVYATAFRFYDAANMIGYLFAALLLPMFAANIHNLEILKNLKEIGLRYVVISAVLIIVSIMFYGKDILSVLFDNITDEFVIVLYILMLSYFMVAVAYIFGTLLVASGKIKKLNIVFGIGLLTNIILNLLLIPKYQAIGAASATLATQSLVLVGQVMLVKSELNIDNKADEYMKSFFFILLSIAVFYTCSHIFLMNWIYNLAFSLIFCLLLSFVLKIVDKQEFISLFKREKK
jgi:O-antigen/teichoic acid export membrane protein